MAAQKPGFLRKYFVAVQRFDKNSWWLSEVETRFLCRSPQYLIIFKLLYSIHHDRINSHYNQDNLKEVIVC